ncbi:hypothetical protein SAMN05660477_00880 [Soonwooa buanensis]|uniref:DUF5675 domain-containing protein n=1 Tax=Soonwooa buanensis TaxID=619805 RepID=A0A1T5DNF8_9FLAO|nr:DUF5675 family protein [Soonwooa buanensis]SKB73216.1 hypothetical protein SAMN05660477_00880 [Soonwooa buanensis]
MKLVLERQYHVSGTNGTLYFEDKEICKTIELAWKNNQRRISCIPEGLYRVKKRFSPKFKWHLEVRNVKNRDLILFHPANNALKELNGCIAPVSELTGEGKGIRSRIAFERLKNILFPYLEKGFVINLTIKKSTT